MADFNVTNLARFLPKTATMRRRLERPARAVRPSKAAEMAYRSELRQIVAHLKRAGAEIVHELRLTWAGDEGFVGDARSSAAPAGADAAFARAASKFGRIDVTAKRLAALAARRNLGEVDRRLTASMIQAVGVDIGPRLMLEPKIARAMARATQANVELITSIPAEYLGKVRAAVQESFQAGGRWEDLAGAVKRIGDVTDERADLIARDQTSKMNAAFNEVRQTSIGIQRYRWSGALDQRERPSHVGMEGVICRWDTPPLVDGENVHAGEAINCRCTGIPMLDLDEVLESEAA